MSGPFLPLNGLTACSMALPTIVGTFIKHCLPSKEQEHSNRPELMFDEALAVARAMAQRLTQYSVEDVQRLANTFQPAPWTVRVVRVSIPASTCLAAAHYLIDAFGPAELATVIGGRQWWQLRGNKDGSVEAEWIVMKRDLSRASSAHSRSASPSELSPPNNGRSRSRSKSPSRATSSHLTSPQVTSPQVTSPRRRSLFASLRRPSTSQSAAHLSHPLPSGVAQDSSHEPISPESPLPSHLNMGQSSSSNVDQNNLNGSPSIQQPLPSDSYEDDMDRMPCMLYIHGGGYYFGSINTHRYAIWRYARKMGGRAFAVNYRLAPQYPFPCALADCLAAYLYLIRPPEGAKHRAIDPSKIVVVGDSAGGGLSLALLTLIRDIGLPLPAGAVLISPWVDLTHSFPSVMSNTDTDIIPPYGFMHQPSVLWPPPKPKPNSPSKPSRDASDHSRSSSGPSSSESVSETTNTSVNSNPFRPKLSPSLKSRINESDGVTPIIECSDGEDVVMDEQIQLYATNDQLTHPYCSPLFSPSLGGLPPLLIIAGQKEVLRDEILYVAHRAAHPDRYPLREELMTANSERSVKASAYPPTKVHLQVYDGMFHVVPMFSFLRPAKYCFRAIGSFCRYVTAPEGETNLDPLNVQLAKSSNPDQNENRGSKHGGRRLPPINISADVPASLSLDLSVDESGSSRFTFSPRQSHRSASASPVVTPRPSSVERMTTESLPPIKINEADRRFLPEATLIELDQTIYHHLLPHRRPSFADGMIRERVAADGTIRPLEDEAELDILKISPEELGLIKEGPIRRWAEGRKILDRKFMRTHKKIQAQRERYSKRSNQRINRTLKKFAKPHPAQKESQGKRKLDSSLHSKNVPRPNQPLLQPGNPSVETDTLGQPKQTSQEALGTRLGWVLPDDERPPPSSIAARQDTNEALKLAKVLEQQIDPKYHIHGSCRFNRAIDADDYYLTPLTAS